MRLLVLGGTWFLGRALVEQALVVGHEVTTFNRGRSRPDVAGVEVLQGDRGQPGDLERLIAGRSWDAVLDTSGGVPCVVREDARRLHDHVGRYVFISTLSVYEGWPVEPITEESAVLDCPADAGPDFGEDNPRGYPTRYSYQKAGCERAVDEQFGGQALVLRPGVILGPNEYIGRLPWWLGRMQRGGRVLAPQPPNREIQPIDVRDVADFALYGINTELAGTFNVAAPRGLASFSSFLGDCRAATGSEAEVVWVDARFLLDQGVREWTEVPLWRTEAGTWDASTERAQDVGLTCRPLSVTVRDTWDWLCSGGVAVEHQRQGEVGIDPDKEERVLSLWDLRARADSR